MISGEWTPLGVLEAYIKLANAVLLAVYIAHSTSKNQNEAPDPNRETKAPLTDAMLFQHHPNAMLRRQSRKSSIVHL